MKAEASPQFRLARQEYLWLGLLLLPLLIFYSVASVRNHELYGTAGFDLGIFDQALWHASRFETPTTTVRHLPSIFGDHFHPAILLLTPLYWFGDGTKNLLAVQPLFVLLAAFPIFAFSRRRMSRGAATLIALAYASSWGVARGLGFDFHELALTASALAFAIDRFDVRDVRGFWIATVALLLTKEDQSLTLAVFGVLALLRRDGVRATMSPIIVGLSWYIFATKVVTPLAAGREYEHWLYGYLAPTPFGLVVYLVSHPVQAVGLLFAPSVKISLWYRTFGTFAFLPLLSPYALLAAPSLLSRLLSSEAIHWEPSYHYSIPIMVILACATADTLERLSQGFKAEDRLVFGGAFVAFAISVGMNRGVLQRDQILHPRTSPETARELDALLTRIPNEASVTADNFVTPHLSQRQWILVADDEKRSYRTDYYVLDPEVRPRSTKLAAMFRRGGDYEEIGRAGATILFRRRPGVASDLPARPGDLPSIMAY